ncbi:MAG: cation:proton antiporter [Erysipelothrix sp.]
MGLNGIIRLLVAIGAAVALGKLVAKLGLPEILGWLIAGMIVGPHALGIVNDSVMKVKSYHIMIAFLESFVGVMIGSELIISKLKASGKAVIVTTVIQSLVTFVVVSAAFAVVFKIMGIPLYVAVVMGSIALATAPAPALSIVKEFNTKGPITDTLLPLAAIDDIIGIIIFFTTVSLIGASSGNSTMTLGSTLFIMIVVPITVGLVIGIGTGFVLRKISSNQNSFYTVLVTVAVLTAVGLFMNSVIFKESLVNFMLLGMAFAAGFANMIEEPKQEALFSSLSPIIGAALIIVILDLGMPLDYHLIFSAGLFTAVYIISRAIGKYVGATSGARLMKMPESVQKYLGFTLLPHSGVSLVFTGIAVTTIMPFDPNSAMIIQGTIAAAAVINEVIAVIIAKKAFELSGEIQS